MDLIELLKGNWINLIIIFVLPVIGFLYKNRSKNDYFDNIIKYADILEKTPQPKYQKDYLNNIKKKLLWEKVCFYQPGKIDKERIAIALVNADTNNMINLSHLDMLTNYFHIKKHKIMPLSLFSIPKVIITSIFLFLAAVIILVNFFTIFNTTNLVSMIITLLTILILLITIVRFTTTPFKVIKMYSQLCKSKGFLTRANAALEEIIKTDTTLEDKSKEDD